MSHFDDRDFAERVAAALRAREPVDATFETRLLVAARAAVARGEIAWQRPNVVAAHPTRRPWLTRPRQVLVSPLVGLAVAAAFAAVVIGATLVVSRGRAAGAQRDIAAGRGPAPEVVRFVIAAPSARAVALVGDFNGWNPSATPLARDSAGTAWMVTVPLTAGTYQYAFVVDGHAWVADPAGTISLEDEFGTPSSMLTVSGRRT